MRWKSGDGSAVLRASLVVLAVSSCVYVVCSGAALLHQHRALEQARAASNAGLHPFTIIGHAARCISLHTPVGGAMTTECVEIAVGVLDEIDHASAPIDARVARSILSGAMESASCESDAFVPVRKLVSGSGISPPGSNPLDTAAVEPTEPWASFACLAGTAALALLAFPMGVRVLGAGRQHSRSARDTHQARPDRPDRSAWEMPADGICFAVLVIIFLYGLLVA